MRGRRRSPSSGCRRSDTSPRIHRPGFATWEDWYVDQGIPEDEWDEGASISDPAGAGPRIYFQQVPEGKVAKIRLHLDARAGGDRSAPHAQRWPAIMATAERLTAVGATLVREDEWQGRPHHVVMADPEGNEFCLC